ncbi:hypothetical protein BDV98DRAFT_659837 [Pterulicium gracile]|uniref:Uncharacterized protein n=1 Tax=Pterulicium gracile TaxID=1884261 RepID=A0A5C3Q4E7_9AGAR|nr:hypothetical protein BDV98DRAFT_659837 [Pterula gracilis]
MYLQQSAKHGLEGRCRALRVFRSRDTHHPDLLPALWVVFRLLIDDEGQNAAQCKVQLDSGWPREDTTNTLVIAVLWLATNEEAISCEGRVVQDRIIQSVAPFVFVDYKYPITRDSGSNYHSSLFSNDEPSSSWTNCLELADPAISLLATVVYFARQETRRPVLPSFLPKTRAEANFSGRSGPTLEDLIQFSDVWTIRFRSTPAFSNGWTILIADHPWKTLTEAFRRPKGFTLSYREGGVEVLDTSGVLRALYEKYRPDIDPASREGVDSAAVPVRDILLIGQNDEDRAAEWGEHSCIGRANMDTGLITFQRTSVQSPGAPIVFHGYLPFGQNLVGRFHDANSLESSSTPNSWSGAFSLCNA